MRKNLILRFCVLVLLLEGPLTLAASQDKDSKTRLDLALTNIETTARRQRQIGGGVLLGLGTAFGVGAIFASNSSNSEVRTQLPLLLGVTGGVLAVGGALVLLLPTDFEELPQKYSELPDGNSDQIQAKVLAGENYLSLLSQRAKRQRQVGGGMLVALGAANLVWYLSSSNKTALSFLPYESVIFVGAGMVTLLVEREPESEARNYFEWKTGKEKSSALLHLDIVPVKSGGALALSWKF